MFASEVLEKTYLAMKGDHSEICFYEPVYAEIANDEKKGKGYTVYKLCFILNEKWLISSGKRCGKKSAERYDSDLAVIPLDSGKNIKELLQSNSYFFYSPIFCFQSGELAIRNESFFSLKGMIDVVTRLGMFEIKKGLYDERIVEHLKVEILRILT